MLSQSFHFALFVKSYRGDFFQFKILKQSIDQFNAQNIPLCVVVPRQDKELFLSCVSGDESYPLIIMEEETFLPPRQQSWFFQQVAKLSFWKTGFCQFYCVLDSDAYFIKRFTKYTFMFNDNVPYTVMRVNRPIRHGMYEYHEKIQCFFQRKGLNYDFCSVPVVFSSAVLRDMEMNFLALKNLTFADLIKISPAECNWYGEYVLKTRPYPIVPIDHFFKIFYIQQEYLAARKLLCIEDFIFQGYVGIVMQSRWVKSRKYTSSIFKSIHSIIDKATFE